LSLLGASLKKAQARCAKCGEAIADGARICAACGEPVRPLADDPARPAGFADARRPTVYAGFWLRAAAYIADSLLLGIAIGFAVLFPLMKRGALPADNPWIFFTAGPTRQMIAIQLLVTLVSWLYFASFESSKWQATPGKRIFGLRVTDLQNRRVSMARASGRYFGKLLSTTLFFVGFLLAGFTPRKQALHDLLARCLVVKKN
jgi:uncharacterized RDD family membrane protein YckC